MFDPQIILVCIGSISTLVVAGAATGVSRHTVQLVQLVSLRNFYNGVVNEPIPQNFKDLLSSLEEDDNGDRA